MFCIALLHYETDNLIRVLIPGVFDTQLVQTAVGFTLQLRWGWFTLPLLLVAGLLGLRAPRGLVCPLGDSETQQIIKSQLLVCYYSTRP